MTDPTETKTMAIEAAIEANNRERLLFRGADVDATWPPEALLGMLRMALRQLELVRSRPR